MTESQTWKSGDQHYFKSFNTFTTRFALLIIAACGFNLRIDWDGELVKEGLTQPLESTIVTVSKNLIPRLALPKWVYYLPIKRYASFTFFTRLTLTLWIS